MRNPPQHKDDLSQTQGVPCARCCGYAPEHSRDKLASEPPEKGIAGILLRLSDFHDGNSTARQQQRIASVNSARVLSAH